jgi:chemotaxis protein MotB
MRKKTAVKKGKNQSDRWLLTYADLITLLLGLFVILYAMSKIDVEKYTELVNALGGVFGRENPGIFSGERSPIPPIVNGVQAQRQKIAQEINSALTGSMKKGLVTVTQNERGITVHMMEELLFASGSAELKASSLYALDTLTGIIARLPNDIRIEGHTDNVPISTPLFPSNWHLSVARAVNTAYYMMGKQRIEPEKISVVGYSEYRPLVANTSGENRARNRRVDIIIVTNAANKDSQQ